MRAPRSVAVLLALTAILAASASARADLAPMPTPDDIFANAQRAWTAHVPPPHLAYTIAVTVTENAVVKTRHYRAHAETMSGNVAANPISAEEAADTNRNVSGTKFVAGIRSHGAFFKKQLGPKDLDALGVPMLAPDYTFGVAHRRLRAYADDDDPASASSADGARTGPQIGRVTAVVRRYSVALVGVETIADRSTYHLALVPLVDPARFRLRDLWVDTATSDVLQLRVAGNFDSPSTRAVPWLVSFRGDGDARYISSEIAEQPIAFADKRRYEAVRIDFSEVTPLRIAPVTLDSTAVVPGLTLLREP